VDDKTGEKKNREGRARKHSVKNDGKKLKRRISMEHHPIEEQGLWYCILYTTTAIA